jgi:hypothetical protein
MVLNVSKSEKCATGNDGTMFVDMKLERIMKEEDCLGLDGGYTLFVRKYIDKHDNVGLTDDNFVYPVRKIKGTKLTENEKQFNDAFGGFRSKIETKFSELGSTFQRYDNGSSNPHVTDITVYNLQIRLAFLLLNMKNFLQIFSFIECHEYHSFWLQDNFDYPSDHRELEYITSTEETQGGKITRMDEIQTSFLQLELMDDNEEISDDGPVEKELEIML